MLFICTLENALSVMDHFNEDLFHTKEYMQGKAFSLIELMEIIFLLAYPNQICSGVSVLRRKICADARNQHKTAKQMYFLRQNTLQNCW